MADITLHYFDFRGRGEIMRMIFHYFGVEFTDRRIQFAEWPEIKQEPLFEFGQCPALEIDGHCLCQTGAIAGYLARKYFPMVQDTYQIYLIQSLGDFNQDFAQGMLPFFKTNDMEGLKKHVVENLERFLKHFERRLVQNNGGEGFFVGETVTIVDMVTFRTLHDFCYEGEMQEKTQAIFEAHGPKVLAWMTRFLESSATFKAYIESRRKEYNQLMKGL